MNTPIFDIAIIGGGCAGLSLCYYLSQLNLNLNIVIIDQRPNYSDDKTWTFWQHKANRHPHEDIISRRWSRWYFSDSLNTVEQHAEQYEYCLIRSIDYYQKMLNIIQHDKRFKLFMNNTYQNHRYDEAKQCHSITTNNQTIEAKIIVNTLPNMQILKNAQLHQVFYGCEVRSADSLFDSSRIGLMTRMQSNERLFEFTYLIPYSATTALIETTHFSLDFIDPDSLQSRCLEEIAKLAPNSIIERTEKGILPMGITRPDSQRKLPNYYDLSQSSGTLRSSSGYGFNRIQQKTQSLARSLFNDQPADVANTMSNTSTTITSFLDAIFLKVLSKNITLAPSLFMKMGSSLRGDDFAGFMSEEYTLSRILNVIKAMPKQVFIREALSWR